MGKDSILDFSNILLKGYVNNSWNYIQYINGFPNEKFRSWYDNGMRKSDAYCPTDTCIFETWFLNGEIESRTLYKNGLKNGKYLLYSEKGSIVWEGNYVDGYKDGKWIYNNGEVLEIYRKGKNPDGGPVFREGRQTLPEHRLRSLLFAR